MRAVTRAVIFLKYFRKRRVSSSFISKCVIVFTPLYARAEKFSLFELLRALEKYGKFNTQSGVFKIFCLTLLNLLQKEQGNTEMQ
jgi:hypothetical protein